MKASEVSERDTSPNWILELGKAQSYLTENFAELDLPTEIAINLDDLKGLPKPFLEDAKNKLKRLHNLYGDGLPKMLAFSLRLAWYNACEEKLSDANCADGNDEIYEINLSTILRNFPSHIEAVGIGSSLGLGYFDDCLTADLIKVIYPNFEMGLHFKNCRAEEYDFYVLIEIWVLHRAAGYFRKGNFERAYFWLFDAKRLECFEHFEAGYNTYQDDQEDGRPESEFPNDFAKKGSDAQHLENRQMKSEAFAWLDGNFETLISMDDAAEKLTKIVPMKWRTVRGWVGQWRKERSAGTK